MYFSKRSHDLVNKADYSAQVLYNPLLALGDRSLQIPEYAMQVCTTVSMVDISQVQKKYDGKRQWVNLDVKATTE